MDCGVCIIPLWPNRHATGALDAGALSVLAAGLTSLSRCVRLRQQSDVGYSDYCRPSRDTCSAADAVTMRRWIRCSVQQPYFANDLCFFPGGGTASSLDYSIIASQKQLLFRQQKRWNKKCLLVSSTDSKEFCLVLSISLASTGTSTSTGTKCYNTVWIDAVHTTAFIQVQVLSATSISHIPWEYKDKNLG